MPALGETRAIIVYESLVPLNCTRQVKIIQERTGHLSLSGLHVHQYEQSCNKQHKAVSQVLSAKENIFISRNSLSILTIYMYLYSNLNIPFLIVMSHSPQSPLLITQPWELLSALSDTTYSGAKLSVNCFIISWVIVVTVDSVYPNSFVTGM